RPLYCRASLPERCRSSRRVPVPAFFFFFQAEDGIRDLYVTGVQTCALPIFRSRSRRHSHLTTRLSEGTYPVTGPGGRFSAEERVAPSWPGGGWLRSPDAGPRAPPRRPSSPSELSSSGSLPSGPPLSRFPPPPELRLSRPGRA